jgi:hypothetical protein
MSKEKPISKDLDRLLEFYASLSLEEREHYDFCRTVRRLIAECAEGGEAEYNKERTEEWREIVSALGDNDPDCAGMGYWSDMIVRNAKEISKIIRGEK